jgi:methyltransferase-like protein
MTLNIKLEDVYAVSEDVVVREIEGELLLIPIASGIGDMEDELYTLNPAGKAILRQLDGARSLDQVAKALLERFPESAGVIEQDVLGLITELVKRNMLIRVD